MELPPIVVGLGLGFACAIAGVILMTLDHLFIGIILLALSPLLALVAWIAGN